jgi:uncharacterized protein (DUF885 family)
MFRTILTTLTATFLLFALSSPGQAATNIQKFEKLSGEILETLQSFYPVTATEMGVHSYDNRLADYSSSSVSKMIKKLDDYEKRLYKLRKTSFDPAQRIDYKLIKSNVDIALQNLQQIAWHRKCPQPYIDEAVNGIYFLLLSQHAPLSEKLHLILSRMRSVPRMFAVATQNIKGSPEIWLELARESLESGIEFYQQAARELADQFPDRADEIFHVSTLAREAMNDFLVHLADMQAGTETGFAIGRKNLDYKLKHEYFLPFDSDSLLRIGQSLLQKASSDYDKYEKYVDEYHQNGQDSIFVPANFAKHDVLDYYNWETRQLRIFIESHGLLTVPEDIAPVSVIETPSFLRSMIAGIAYQPAGPFDENQHGYFYVRPIPDDLDARQLEAHYRYILRRGFKGSIVHEAFPGHHLQMQIAGDNPSQVRKWQNNVMMIEGWALLCEEMMYHAGLYGEEDPAQWLAILGGIRFRAARIVADVKLHTGEFTYQQCVDWMIDVLDAESESEKAYLRKSVRKYTLTPTVWMSYLMGKREIERLRDAAKSVGGPLFSEQVFYDHLLAEGSIPPALLWEALDLTPAD